MTEANGSNDFPYVPKHEHIRALDEFVEVDFEVLQNSPSPKKNGNKKKHHHRHLKNRRKNNSVFTIAGESGSGKTSLLKYWSDQRRITHRAPQNANIAKGSPGSGSGSTRQLKEFIFFYGVNSSRDAQLSNMLGKLESALKQHFQLRELFVRKSPAHRRWDLVRYLESSATKSRTPIIIVIDGLSRLKMESGVEADPMLWLPRDLPHKVRFIVSLTEYEVPPIEHDHEKQQHYKNNNPASTSTSTTTATIATTALTTATTPAHRKKTASFVELERRKTPSLSLGVLLLATRRKILATYAKYHRKSFDLSNDKVMQILASQGSGHPLYLRVLLNSLRTAARLSCIPAIAVGTLLDSVMEGEKKVIPAIPTLSSPQSPTNTSKDGRMEDDRIRREPSESTGRTTPTTPLTWEERQLTMSKGAFTAADQEVASLLETRADPNSTSNLAAPLHMSDGTLPSAVEMVIALALRRCEEDVEMELDGSDKGLLGRVLSLLYVSHHGLTENELLGCVALSARDTLEANRQNTSSPGRQPTPVSTKSDDEKWHRTFQHQFEQHRETLRLILDDICMVVRAVDPSVGDMTTLSNPNDVRVIMEHESVRRVVWKQYLDSSYVERDRNHEMLARYFETIVPVCPRRVEELPWHYEQLQQYGKLRDTVTDVDMFRLWWGDSRMDFYRSELVRVWSVLTLPPVGLDLVEEIRSAFEIQITARHMRDDSISILMLQVAELTIAFQRGGWENNNGGLDCPDQRHPAIPLADLVHNGVPVLQLDLEGEESGEARPFVELVKASRHNLDEDAPAPPTVNHETVEFIGEHYYYSRWMWAQFPLILLGFADMYSHKVAKMAIAKSSSASAEKNKPSPSRRDPIISRLRQLAHKRENPDQNDSPVSTTSNESTQPAAQKKKEKNNDGNNLFMTATEPTGRSVQEVEGDEHETTPTPQSSRATKHRGGPQQSSHSKPKKRTTSSTTPSSPMLAQKSKPHPNSPFILDVHSGDRHEGRLESMTESIMKQRRVLNAMLIAERGKKKVLAAKRDELTVMNGLSKGAEISLESALKLVAELDSIAERTENVNTLSNFYRNILQLCKAFGANQPEWLQMLDQEIARGRRKQITTKQLIKAVIEQRREIASLLNEARTTHFRRRGVLTQMLDRIDFQHARELENVQNEKQWKQRQAMMLRDDIVNENRLKMQRAEDERKATEEQKQARNQARNNTLTTWRVRLQRLKDATGVSTMDEMLSLVASRSQLTTENNLSVLVKEQETKISTLTLQKEKLRNEMMKLRFSYNKAKSGGILSTVPNMQGSDDGGSSSNGTSPHKKELYHIAEKEMAVQRARAQVEHIRRELAHVNRVIIDVKVGLEHITRMCGVNFDDAETAREEESKTKTLYFEPSHGISERDRAESTMDLLAKVEAKLVGKIADLQRLAPRTPKSRGKRRKRQSKSRDGRRRSQSRDGRVGSPLR